ncbi:MAG TPA: hypothetical protein VG711_09890, partial [Phycisphaerales bacterium]|nr:hypothetical protein [Phycisphaerales bacterium]
GIENINFLIFPSAQIMKTPGDMSMMGRTMVLFFIKFFIMLVTFGAIAVLGAIAYFTTYSWLVLFIVVWLALVGEAIAIVPVIAKLFDRLDPASIDLSQ